jgi:hypothetical protein
VCTVAYKTVAVLEIAYGEYAARCGCRRTFRNHPEGVRPRARYDGKVRVVVLDQPPWRHPVQVPLTPDGRSGRLTESCRGGKPASV